MIFVSMIFTTLPLQGMPSSAIIPNRVHRDRHSTVDGALDHS